MWGKEFLELIICCEVEVKFLCNVYINENRIVMTFDFTHDTYVTVASNPVPYLSNAVRVLRQMFNLLYDYRV